MGSIEGLINLKINLVQNKKIIKCKDLIKLLMGQINFIMNLIGKKLSLES